MQQLDVGYYNPFSIVHQNCNRSYSNCILAYLVSATLHMINILECLRVFSKTI